MVWFAHFLEVNMRICYGFLDIENDRIENANSIGRELQRSVGAPVPKIRSRLNDELLPAVYLFL